MGADTSRLKFQDETRMKGAICRLKLGCFSLFSLVPRQQFIFLDLLVSRGEYLLFQSALSPAQGYDDKKVDGRSKCRTLGGGFQS